jgi:hypothetical protein
LERSKLIKSLHDEIAYKLNDYENAGMTLEEIAGVLAILLGTTGGYISLENKHYTCFDEFLHIAISRHCKILKEDKLTSPNK